MDSAQLEDIAERLFAAFVAHDLDRVATMVAPDVVLTQNGVSSSFAEARVALGGLRNVLGDHRYEDVRRVVGDSAVVEEHRVLSTTPAGRIVDLAACVVLRVNDAGLITALDEYVDVPPFLRAG